MTQPNAPLTPTRAWAVVRPDATEPNAEALYRCGDEDRARWDAACYGCRVVPVVIGPGWQPIDDDTPRDGTVLLLTGWWCNESEGDTRFRWISQGHWHADIEKWVEHEDYVPDRVLIPPTHWQPLPPPPAPTETPDDA